MPLHSFFVNSSIEPIRLDSFLHEKLPDITRSHMQKKIKNEFVTVNGKKTKKCGFLLHEGMEISINIQEAVQSDIVAESIDLEIVYEDKNLIIINKSSGMVVHPSDTGHESGTVVNAVMYYCGDELSGIGGVRRPGIVHRLDKGTSGLLMIAKNDAMHQHLSKIIAQRRVTKKYTTLVVGKLVPESGTIEAPIGRSSKNRKKMSIRSLGKSRDAVSHYRVLQYFEDATLIEVQIITGRTHQIRVHFESIHHPVIGDELYGYKKINDHYKDKYGLERIFLHAAELSFDLPDGENCHNKSPLPTELQNVLDLLA